MWKKNDVMQGDVGSEILERERAVKEYFGILNGKDWKIHKIRKVLISKF